MVRGVFIKEAPLYFQCVDSKVDPQLNVFKVIHTAAAA